MPSLDKRKIHTTGHSLAVTLPRGWIRFLGLSAGDEVEIISNGDLVIRPLPPRKSEAVSDDK